MIHGHGHRITLSPYQETTTVRSLGIASNPHNIQLLARLISSNPCRWCQLLTSCSLLLSHVNKPLQGGISMEKHWCQNSVTWPYVLNTYDCIWLYIQRTFTVCWVVWMSLQSVRVILPCLTCTQCLCYKRQAAVKESFPCRLCVLRTAEKVARREWCCLEEAESSYAALRHVVAMVHRPFPQMYWFNKCQTNIQWLPMRPQYVLKCVHCLIFTKIILSSMSLDTCTYKTEKQNGSNNGILTSRLLLSDLHWEKTWKNNDSLSSRLWSTPVSHLKSDPRGTYHLILKSCAHIIHFRNLGTSVFRHKLDCALAMELWNWSCTTLWCET